jgi:hypothetical protein
VVAHGSRQRLLPDWSSEPIALFLAYHSRLNQPLAVRKLIDHLAHVLGDQPNPQETTPPVVTRTPLRSNREPTAALCLLAA